ncbi:hypothetical protein ASPBRDRAFT_676287 [Aspergillus brasiliensis CBS 101740]|uniref:AAA+ ATPase domain-containing protein n=1 Tax=Aspergillus brasiliensis (strain CBS 101740 / IMI 381727 / IBT 21946) TaxID=767769 RepID=A0A1L9UHX5_ASPBC|nr:hypothetical protein ASPBRDRAFT_676287 [Aspergillus brasiliensis CBS 101740]
MSEHKVPRVIDFTPVVRQHLEWYNSFLPASEELFKLDRHAFRRHRESQHTVNDYQMFYTDMACYINVRREYEQNFQTICCTDDTRLRFSIRGGAELPHFCLELQLYGPKPENKQKSFTIIWTAFGDKGFDVDRPVNKPNENPRQGCIHTFSSRLQGVQFSWTTLSTSEAAKCRGTPNTDNYTIIWGHSEAPYSMGFDLSIDALGSFSAGQTQAVNIFRQLLSGDMQVRVITRARGNLLENWKFLAAMPMPTLGPFPLYDCRYVSGGSWCRIETLPTISDQALGNHIGVRDRGWMNKPPSFVTPHALGNLMPSVYHFINERHYEVIKTVGLLREAEYQRTTYCNTFNGSYTFSVYPMSSVHGVHTEGVDKYFYAILDVTAVRLPSDVFVENESALPEPGTPVTVSQRARDGTSKETWLGAVIKRPSLPSNIRIPSSLVAVRLKRSDQTPTGGHVLEVSGVVKFGNEQPAIRQARQAIRYVMYGDHNLKIPKHNNLRELLLAHNNSTIKDELPVPPPAAAQNYLGSIRATLNDQQIAAVQEGITPSTCYKNYVTLITGPPGTGKTSVSAHIAGFHRKWRNPVLIVCGSNYGLDEITRKILKLFKKEGLRTDGIFRLDTELGEDVDNQMAPEIGHPPTETQGHFNSTRQSLRDAGIDPKFLELLRLSVETTTAETDKMLTKEVSLGKHILRRVELAVQLKSQWPQRTQEEQSEMALLWSLLTYEISLARRGLLFAESMNVDLSLRGPSELFDDPESPEDQLKSLVTSYKRAWLELQQFYIERAAIVLCTASTAGRKALKTFSPKIIIVEEATQISESTSVSPLIRFYPSVKKVVMSGDVAQLPPTVTSISQNEAYNSERLSLFERFLTTGVRHILLTTQYRMHPSIARFVSESFYEGKLITDASASRHTPEMETFMTQRYNVAPGRSHFVSVKGSEVWRLRHGTSLFNPQYISAATKFVRDLCRAKCPPGDILVLSYYAEERNLLKKLLHDKFHLNDVDVMSVDAAQGREKPIVIVSTTRPGRGNKLGHVADAHRMCVALSRAQGGLIVIGDEGMGGSANSRAFQLWRNFIYLHRKEKRVIYLDSLEDVLRDNLGVPNDESFERLQ